MKLTIKTLQQSTFKVEIDPDKTVKELKEQIERDHGKDYPSGAQKLIYSGKILADDIKLAEYEIDEKKFVVLMITRLPPAPKPPAVSEEPIQAKKDEGTTSSKASDDSNTKSSTQSSTTTQSTVSATPLATSTPTLATTPNTNAATPAEARTRPTSGGMDSTPLSLSEPQLASRLAAIMNQPNFRQIQDLIQQSPHLLSSNIEALAGNDPEMYNFISENPDIFASALNCTPSGGGRRQLTRRSLPRRDDVRGSSQQESVTRNPAGRQQPVVDQILGDVSEHDKEAIERLKELGFSEYLAVQAYMACDKDEQLAANLLFQMDQ